MTVAPVVDRYHQGYRCCFPAKLQGDQADLADWVQAPWSVKLRMDSFYRLQGVPNQHRSQTEASLNQTKEQRKYVKLTKN